MALKVKTKIEEYEYIPLSERDQENPFTIKLRRLTPKEFSFIEDKMLKMYGDASMAYTSGTYNWNVVKKGIIGWENLIDEDNKPIKIVIGSDGVTDDSLNFIPPDIISEVAAVIVALTKDPDDAKTILQVV